MAQSKLPGNCRVLVIENEPLQALALELVLEEIGCHPIGPVWQANDVQRAVRREAPNLAIVDSNLQSHLLPVVECLNRHRVPFAFLAVGDEGRALDSMHEVREHPRLDRPFHSPTVFRAARQLYRQDLEEKIARADQRLAEGRRRLSDQLRLIEQRLEKIGDTGNAQIVAREIARGLRAMRASRAMLLEQLDAIDDA